MVEAGFGNGYASVWGTPVPWWWWWWVCRVMEAVDDSQSGCVKL